MTIRRRGMAPRNSSAGNSELRRGTCQTCKQATDMLWSCLICERRLSAAGLSQRVEHCRRHHEAHNRTFHSARRG